MSVIAVMMMIAEKGDGTPVPEEGDWNITEATVIHDAEVNVTGNINVTRGTVLAIKDSTLRVNHTSSQRFTLRIEAGATLIVVNSTLILDAFESDPQSSVDLSNDTVVRTNGLCALRSRTLFANGVTFLNTAPPADSDEDGNDAVMVLDGSVNSEFRGVTVRNVASRAGMTGPGMNGSAGGNALIISNVTSWTDCTIECVAGAARGGGLGLTGASGGSGGPGGDARVLLRASEMEGVEVDVRASDGGVGARGADSQEGQSSHGGDGGAGGNASLEVQGKGVLVIDGCVLSVRSGNGGSGGNGGGTENGTAGNGGVGATAGIALIRVRGVDNVYINETEMTAVAGEGGYGGNYGRAESSEGEFGSPGKGGDGNLARVEVTDPDDLFIYDLTVESRGGAGLDGGSGYEQGEQGGDGGDGEIVVFVNGTLEADVVDLRAMGGNGGPGGPAFSEIRGKGGDGGKALANFTGLQEMDVSHFSIYVMPGEGGLGNLPIYDGEPGIGTLDVETQLLHMREGVLNMPLDDLSGEARGYLYNVTFDMEFGIHVLPKGDAIVLETYPVIVSVDDDPDPDKAEPLVGWEVSVFNIDTGALVAHRVTDGKGLCHFDLLAFEYTSQQVNYIGSYHFIATTPDRKTTKKVRGEIQGHTTITISVAPWPPYYNLDIIINEPEVDKEYKLYTTKGDHLVGHGYIIGGEHVTTVFVQLLPVDGEANEWPRIKLGLSPVPYEDLEDKDARWGKYFPPDTDSNRWPFFVRFPIDDEAVEYESGEWLLRVTANTVEDIETDTVTFDLLLDSNLERPWIRVLTDIHGRTFNGSIVSVEGEAGDDLHILLVQARLDSGEWFAVATDEEWSYALDTGTLGDGTHTIDFRAFDGFIYSNINASAFQVLMADGPSGNGNDGDDGIEWNTQTVLIAAGAVLLIVALALVMAIVVVRRRSPPDSLGEG